MPSLLSIILNGILTVSLPWLQSKAPALIVSIVEELLVFLKGTHQAFHVEQLGALFEHIKLFTRKAK